jgi:hypothetical protein
MRPRPNPIQIMFVPSHEDLCLTPTTLNSEPRLSSETLVSIADREKTWSPRSKHGRSFSRGGYEGPDRPSLEATIRRMHHSPLQPLEKAFSSPH